MLTASVILAIATIVLVGVTSYYAWQTHRMVVEMQKQRHDSALAFIAFKHSATGDNADANLSARHKIVNSGPGTALGINAKVRVVERNERNQRNEREIPYTLPALGPGGKHEVFLVLAAYQIKGFEATYRDVYGREFSVDQEVLDDTSSKAQYQMNGKPIGCARDGGGFTCQESQ
jgi:hypothetical protein